MPIFLEKYFIPLLVAATIGLVLLNQLGMDWHQRVSLCVAIVALAYFTSHTIQRRKPAEEHASVPTAGVSVQPRAKMVQTGGEHQAGGDVSVTGDVKAGNGKLGDGGSVLIAGGNGGPGGSGGNATIGPGTYRAGDGGPGGGKGGDIIFRGGDAGGVAPQVTFSDAERLVLIQGLEHGRNAEVTVVQIGGAEARAVGTQVREAFSTAGWRVKASYVGQLIAMVVGDSDAGAVTPHGLYLITKSPDEPAPAAIVSAFENAGHPVSLNGSKALRPEGDIALYIVFQK